MPFVRSAIARLHANAYPNILAIHMLNVDQSVSLIRIVRRHALASTTSVLIPVRVCVGVMPNAPSLTTHRTVNALLATLEIPSAVALPYQSHHRNMNLRYLSTLVNHRLVGCIAIADLSMATQCAHAYRTIWVHHPTVVQNA